MSILLWFLGSSLGRAAGIALLSALALAGYTGYVVVKTHNADMARIERADQKHITEGNAASASAVKRFDAGKLRDDGWRRD